MAPRGMSYDFRIKFFFHQKRGVAQQALLPKKRKRPLDMVPQLLLAAARIIGVIRYKLARVICVRLAVTLNVLCDSIIIKKITHLCNYHVHQSHSSTAKTKCNSNIDPSRFFTPAWVANDMRSDLSIDIDISGGRDVAPRRTPVALQPKFTDSAIGSVLNADSASIGIFNTDSASSGILNTDSASSGILNIDSAISSVLSTEFVVTSVLQSSALIVPQ
ncbi:hypothetical protein J6590_019767 [Homalodisca vitripennis]|nr:hypothetical protein J6590_019767 [Homalodisca vitripennis]